MTDSSTSRRDVLKTTGLATGAAVATSLLGSTGAARAHEINAMGPTPEQAQAFLALPDEPIVMVNLLKFKPDGGREHYNEYGREVGLILRKIGARLIFSGEARVCLIGGGDWDRVALVEYPNPMALIQMSQSEEYQAIHHHRAAGLEGQVNYAVVQTGGA